MKVAFFTSVAALLAGLALRRERNNETLLHRELLDGELLVGRVAS
jgi:hypothetical protein